MTHRRAAALTVVALAAAPLPVVTGVRADPTPAQFAASVLAIRGEIESLESQTEQGQQVVVAISADVLFDFGKATLTPAAQQVVGRLANQLRASVGPVQVDGYTDSMGAPCGESAAVSAASRGEGGVGSSSARS